MVAVLAITALNLAILVSQPVRRELILLPTTLTLFSAVLVHLGLVGLGISAAGRATPELVLPLASGLLGCLVLVARPPSPQRPSASRTPRHHGSQL